jgi:protein TonB
MPEKTGEKLIEQTKNKLPEEKPMEERSLKETPIVQEEPVVNESPELDMENARDAAADDPCIGPSEPVAVNEETAVWGKPLPAASDIDNLVQEALAKYKVDVQRKIRAARHYPLLARRMSQEGVVRIKFLLNKDGTVKGTVDIIKRCRYGVLNDAAVDTIVRANPYPPFPPELAGDEMTFTIDIDFQLDDW